MNDPSKGQGALRPQLQAGGEGPTGWGRASSDVQSGTGRPLRSSSRTVPCLGSRRASPCSHTFIPARQRALQAPPEVPCPKSAGGPQGLGRGAPSGVLAWVMALQPTGTPSFCLTGGRVLFGQGARGLPRSAWTMSLRVPRPWAPRPHLAHTHHMPFAGQRDEHVAAFMDQQLAVDAPVALPCETPYPFAALATVRSLQARTAAIKPCPTRDPAQHWGTWHLP